MKKIWLVDFDGKIENLALMKLSQWHKSQGDKITLKVGMALPELFEMPDQVYISCLFSWNKTHAEFLREQWNGKAELGGPGISVTKSLPNVIESIKPDYTLYGRNRAIGFISRGCIRKCPWCIVPKKEGSLKRVTYAKDIVDGKEQAIFLDNNFLALSDYHIDLEWLAKNRVEIDFNQGLDARMITEDAAKMLSGCKWLAGPRFALDSDAQIPSIKRAFGFLTKAGIKLNNVTLFILIGFWGLESDVRRLRIAHHFDVHIFPMGFRDLVTGEEPAKGWPKHLYRKYKRLFIRLPHAKSVKKDFEKEIKPYLQ